MHQAHGQITDRLLHDPALTLDGWRPDRDASLRPAARRAAVGYRVGRRRRPSWWARHYAAARVICRTHPVGRVAAALVWIGSAIATTGLAQLTAELRRNGPQHGPGRGRQAWWLEFATRQSWAALLNVTLVSLVAVALRWGAW